MTHTNVDVIRSGYDAFAAGDVPAVLDVLSEDIEWHISGRNPLSGDYAGHDAVVGFFQHMDELSNGSFDLDVHDIVASGDDTVVVLVTENAERKDTAVAFPGVHVWRLKDGMATDFRAFQHDDHEADEFWS